MKILGLRGFLLHFLRRRRIRIYVLRGGLGNQLFQITNGIMIAEEFNFDIAFHDVDVKRNPRDQRGAESLDLPFHNLTDKIAVYRCGSSMQIPMRIFMSKCFRSTLTTNLDVEQINSNQANTFGILQGYLQNLNFRHSFADHAISQVIQGPMSENDGISRIAIHLRALDSLKHPGMSLSKSFYENALGVVAENSESKIDVFSDDIDFAQEFCKQLGSFQFNFVEQRGSLSATELLLGLSSYEKIISSKSTLSWWACFLASSTREDTLVISPWDKSISLKSWRFIAP
jgi:hypothetical protein